MNIHHRKWKYVISDSKVFDQEKQQYSTTIDLRHIEKRYSTIENNLSILHDRTRLKEEYPFLFKIIGGIIRYLVDFNDYSADKFIYGYVVEFFVSSRHLPKVYRYSSHNTWNRNINIFCTLGLVQKVHLDLVGRSRKRRAIREKKQLAKQLSVREDKLKEINFYKIPLYDEETLNVANDRAKVMVEHNFRMGGFSKIFLIKVFGKHLADSVFPDERVVTKYSNYVAIEIEKFILNEIELYGYTTKDRIINNLEINLDKVETLEYGFHKGRMKNIISREFDRSITDIKDMYVLEYRPANKEFQEKFGLKSHKTIIYRGEDHEKESCEQDPENNHN